MSSPAPRSPASAAHDPGSQIAGTVRLTVHTAPTTHALMRLLTVVRGRGGQILDLHWQAGPAARQGTATLVVALERARHHHLQAAIGRLVDVRTVLGQDPVDATDAG
jgi:acetolactate synthase regulatory subunit